MVPVTPRRLSGRYELGELLGLGGMSEVHLARDLRLHRDVAVKLLRADLAADPALNLRFQREARDAAALNHPAIAATYDTGEEQTTSGPLPYIVMEYVDGLTLRDVLRTDGPMRARRAIEVIAAACEALNFSHQRGIIHRDVKPANIMIGAAGAVKVVDFGIAKALAGSDHSVTETGAVMGTAQYLSPEQARGGRVDARADVYSLGCVLYEMSTGEPPFTGDSPVAVAYQHVRQEPVAPSKRNGDVLPALDAVVLRAMAKNPDNRYQTAADMRADLLRLYRGLPPDASSSTADRRSATGSLDDTLEQAPSEPTTPGGRSVGRWLVVVAVLAVLVAIATIGIDVVRNNHRDVTVPNVLVPTEPDGSDVPTGASTGPARLTVPDVASSTYADAVRILTDAGFGRFQQAFLPSSPEQKDRVLITNPTANRTIDATNVITIVLGSGPVAAVP